MSAVEKNIKEDGPIFFWHEEGSEYSYLSQWYASPFHTGDPSGTIYQSAEQYMMHQKAILFGDPLTASKILLTVSPKTQKSLGRQVQNFDQKIWEDNRERIVDDGSYFKFKYGKDEGEGSGDGEGLKKKLLGTGGREIVEASPMDRIWGVGFGAKNAEKRRKDWGLNLLGKSLIRVRERLRTEEAEEGWDDVQKVDVSHETEEVADERPTKRRRGKA
jgi:ribA/ribD-fused uncharacterized protein